MNFIEMFIYYHKLLTAMSIAYLVGFASKPKLKELDGFLRSLGFAVEAPGQRRGTFSRVYVLNGDPNQPDIEFFYKKNPNGNMSSFGDRGKDVMASGELKTNPGPTQLDMDERLRIIEQEKVWTEQGWVRRITPETLKFYEIALAIRDQYKARVVSEQTGQEIGPTRQILSGK